MCNFNPRSREGSDADKVTGETFSVDFNPRSREGSDFIRAIVASFTLISIHAPAKGATQELRPEARLLQFQSTLPRRERPFSAVATKGGCAISIHAPAKGATGSKGTTENYYSDFNPRSREGSDPMRSRSVADVRHFNPRSREGSDNEGEASGK